MTHLTLGTRGATSAEYFLKAGYAVIFMHRQHSLRPFSRHYSHSLNPFLDLLAVQDGKIVVKDPAELLPVLEAYHKAQAGTLLSVDFNSVNEYLWLLRSVAQVMSPLGRRGMYYLAAAVSDFFLPEERLVSLSLDHELTAGRTQDSIYQRLAHIGDGSSS